MALTQTRLAKVSIFSEEKNNLSPSVCTCSAIKYGSKLSTTFYKDESIYYKSLEFIFVKGKKMHMYSACSIFIINARLWKTLQVTLLF